MLAGAYPSDEFAELKPRVVWDRVTDVIEGRRDARVVAVTSGGTIPDRGLYGVFMAGEAGTPGRRVGELDEEMVYELRAGMHGDVIVLGASSWRVDDIGRDRVTVSPAPGVPGKLPFWKGDAVGRPIELGRALGAFVGELEADLARGVKGRQAATTRLRETHDLDERAADNLLAYLDDEREVTSVLPTDKRIVVERFRDELGDWRLCLLTPFGGRVHAPWSLALEARIGERLGLEVQTIWSDDGIAIRLPEGDAPLDGIEALLFPEADEVEDLVVGQLATSALFASRFRENAARALLLPRRRPGTRTPLWQQRQRAADLLAVASRYGSFPILVETYRECLSDVFDLPALREILAGVASREIAVHSLETAHASPFAGSLMFDYVAAYMYDGDTPLAERRAGRPDPRPRPAARAARPGGAARAARSGGAGRPRAEPPVADRRAARDDPGRHPRPAAPAGRPDHGRGRGPDRGRHRRGRAVAGRAGGRPPGRPRPGRRRGSLAGDRGRRPLSRRGRHLATGRGPGGVPRSGRRRPGRAAGPVRPDARTVPDARAGASLGSARRRRRRRARAAGRGRARSCAASSGRAARNASGATRRSCACSAGARWRASGARSNRSIRRRWRGSCPTGRAWPRSVAARPVRRCAAAPPWSGWPRSSTSWPGCRSRRPSSSGTCCRPRIPGYQPRLLDELGALGEVAWVGRGSLGRDDGRIALVRPGREILRPTGTPDGVEPPAEPRHVAIREHLAARGASFYRELFTAARGNSDREVLDALWDLVWAGEVTNDTFAPLRALRWKRTGSGARRTVGRPGRLTALGPPEAAGRWSLVAPDAEAVARPTERLHALSLALLERHGVLTREAVATEGIDGGFAAVYPILRAMEDAGRIRRGYFVDGLGAAQFALAGALDRLRAVREPADVAASGAVHLLAAADPANAYGAALPWPRRGETDRRPLQRAAGAYVVLVDGVATLYLERGGATLQTLPAADDPAVAVTGGPRPRARSSSTAGSASWSSARSTARRSAGRVSGRLCSRPASSPAIAGSRCGRIGTGPECPRATRSFGPRPGSGRTSSGGR